MEKVKTAVALVVAVTIPAMSIYAACCQEAKYVKETEDCDGDPECKWETWKNSNGECFKMWCVDNGNTSDDCEEDSDHESVEVTRYEITGNCFDSTEGSYCKNRSCDGTTFTSNHETNDTNNDKPVKTGVCHSGTCAS